MVQPSLTSNPDRRREQACPEPGRRACPEPGRRACPEPGRRALLSAALLLVGALSSLAAGALALGHPAVRGQELPTLGIDGDPSANAATSLGPIDACAAGATGRNFDVDIFIQDVNDLLAWEVYIEYDPQLLEVVRRRVDLFQAANPGSNVFDVSDRLPDRDGLYRIAAADISDPPTPDSGSGPLARLTFKAIGSGLGTIALASRDLDGDGKPDLGPFLRDVDAEPIGDIDSDTFFDGPTRSAQVAIDSPCPNGAAAPGGAEAGGIATAAWAIAGAAAGVAVAGLGGLILFRIARQRART